MTETEQAIKAFESFVQYCEENPRESKLVDEFDLKHDRLALEALKEKAEREKGCEWCDDHNYKQPSEWIWGERIHIIKPHYFCVGDGIAHYEEAEYCPKCGRKLVSEE